MWDDEDQADPAPVLVFTASARRVFLDHIEAAEISRLALGPGTRPHRQRVYDPWLPACAGSRDQSSLLMRQLRRRGRAGVRVRSMAAGEQSDTPAKAIESESPHLGDPPNIPALDKAINQKAFLNLAVRNMIGQVPAFAESRSGQGWLTNLVRLCDKAAMEYDAGRLASLDYASNRHQGRISPYFRVIDHMESCVNALHRALLHAERIRGLKDPPPIDRTAWRALHEASSRLNDVRNAIEHTEQMLARGKLPEGQPVILAPGRDGVSIGSHHIRYAELARCISRLHQIMSALLEVSPAAGESRPE